VLVLSARLYQVVFQFAPLVATDMSIKKIFTLDKKFNACFSEQA
jgi:hypothetical protein